MGVLQDIQEKVNKAKMAFSVLSTFTKPIQKKVEQQAISPTLKEQAKIAGFVTDTAKSIARAPGRAGARLALSARNEPTFVPQTPIEKVFFGKEPVTSIKKGEENAKRELTSYGISPKVASTLATVGVVGGTLMDLIPITSGKGKAAKEGAEEVLKTGPKSKIFRSGVEDVVKWIGKTFAEGEDVSKTISSLGKKIGETRMFIQDMKNNIAREVPQELKGVVAYMDSIGKNGEWHVTTKEGIEKSLKDGGWNIGKSIDPEFIKGLATEAENANIAKIAPKLKEVVSSIGVGENAGKTPEEILKAQVLPALENAKSLRKKQDVIYAAQRAERFAKSAGIRSSKSGEEGALEAMGALKGELTKVQFEPLEVAQDTKDVLYDAIKFSPNLADEGEKTAATEGLRRIFGKEGGALPTPSQLEVLDKVFGQDFTKAVLEKRTLNEKILQNVSDAVNVPRALMASFDLSAPFRQGAFLVGRPKQWVPAFGTMFKTFGSETAYKALNKEIVERSTYPLMKEYKLALTDMGSVLTSREESFMSTLAEKIPGIGKMVKASGRAYSGFLNKIRADTFDALFQGAKEVGAYEKNPSIGKDIAKFVNAATGRGDLGRFEQAGPLLNGIFFSPRLMASRLNLLNPTFYYKLDPYVRKEALKSLVTFAGTGMTVLGLSKLAGAEVGGDPRSADFGKIKVGNTRYDIWGGFQQPIKLAAQLLSGEMVSTTTGKVSVLGEGYKPLTRKDIIFRFFENKESPVASFVTQMLEGTTNTGQKFDLPSEVVNRFIPIMAQDMFDLYREGGFASVLLSAPGIFGVGSQTYGGPNSTDESLGGILTNVKGRTEDKDAVKTKVKPKVQVKVSAKPKVKID